MLQHRDRGLVQVVADQAQIQIPALRAAVGPLEDCRPVQVHHLALSLDWTVAEVLESWQDPD